MSFYTLRERESARIFSNKLFADTRKAIDFVNEHHENFQILIDNKRINFDKIVIVESRFGIDVFVHITSTRSVSIDWSLKDIVLKI